jgi:hypothetical protein
MLVSPTFFLVLSVLLVACESFRPTRFSATKSTKLQSNQQPTTSQENWKQSLKGLINVGVAGSAFMGLTAAALAAETAKAPVISTPAPGPPAPVTDADGFTTSDSGLKSRDTKVSRRQS